MPHGVLPAPQLLKVPRLSVPVGSASVFIRSWPAAGPEIFIGVVWVMRRLSGLSWTIAQPSGPSATSITVTPCRFCSLRTSSALCGLPSGAPGRLTSLLVYSWLTAITCRPSTTKNSMPSVFSPNTLSASSALPAVSWSSSGAPGNSGSPQLASTFQL